MLRFWESKFTQIKPLKRGGGRRYYRPEDLLLLKRIRDLLYKDGYTIRGVQKLLREQSAGRHEQLVKSRTPSPSDLAPGGQSLNRSCAILYLLAANAAEAVANDWRAGRIRPAALAAN